MTWSIDARIPVRALAEGEAVPDGAALLDGFAAEHVPGCTCCVARSPGAVAFDRLFLARVKGERAFSAVVVRGEKAAVQSVVEGDVVVRARFRWVRD
ncbi:hypothetical protein GXW79_20765 [Roseomonas arctica]|uniref:Uncharacterized protein n=2 Tax=Plastoroseomonas arctica TaxID=1509237 RepID=A0AAF1K078_9PROT|nr:hypothetical protein [Plastoroseomonas arctica]